MGFPANFEAITIEIMRVLHVKRHNVRACQMYVRRCGCMLASEDDRCPSWSFRLDGASRCIISKNSIPLDCPVSPLLLSLSSMVTAQSVSHVSRVEKLIRFAVAKAPAI